MTNGHNDPELDVKILSTSGVRVADSLATHELEESKSPLTAAPWVFYDPCLALTSKCLHPNLLYPPNILLGVKKTLTLKYITNWCAQIRRSFFLGELPSSWLTSSTASCSVWRPFLVAL
jgi:hypothetical protein